MTDSSDGSDRGDYEATLATEYLRRAIVALPIALVLGLLVLAIGSEEPVSGAFLIGAILSGAIGLYSLARGLWYRVG